MPDSSSKSFLQLPHLGYLVFLVMGFLILIDPVATALGKLGYSDIATHDKSADEPSDLWGCIAFSLVCFATAALWHRFVPKNQSNPSRTTKA